MKTITTPHGKIMEDESVEMDGDGHTLHEGDRVFTHGFGCERHYGTLHRNTEFPEVSDWWIEYDDKEQFAVLDFADVFKG